MLPPAAAAARLLIGAPPIKDVDRSPTLGSQGYTDGRVKCRKPVEEPGTVPRVRIGNFVALLIERVALRFYKLENATTCEMVNKSGKVIFVCGAPAGRPAFGGPSRHGTLALSGPATSS